MNVFSGNMLVMAQGAAPQGGMLPLLVYMGIFFAIVYFMMIRPQNRREKERRAMIDNIKSGDRVLCCGGLIGTVANIKDKENIFIVKLADNVKVEVARVGVSKVLDKGEKVSTEN